MKHILLLTTGGTIASRKSSRGLSPQMKAEELLRKAGVPGPTGLRAEFSEYQPNSIFTYQGCTSDEIYTAMLMAERKVERKLGVKLERSLTLIGSFRDLTL